MKIAVVYQSKYGSTRQYAVWIAEALDAVLLERTSVTPKQLASYDAVIYGGGLYAGGIDGIGLVTKNPCKLRAVFTVGLSDPVHTDYSEIITKNIPLPLRDQVKIFHLRGGADYSKLSALHRIMMALMKKMINKKPKNQLTEDDREFLKTYGKTVNFTNSDSIGPLIEYFKKFSSIN